MTEILAKLAVIAPRYDAVLCDLWGCLHNGVTPFPAAVAALQAFRAQGGKVVLLTNAPRPKPSVVAHLDAMGVPRDVWDEVVTSEIARNNPSWPAPGAAAVTPFAPETA